jgi:surface protein
MNMLFYGAASFHHDVSSWDVGAVTSMGNMFGGTRCQPGSPARWCQLHFPLLNKIVQQQCSPC